MNIFFKIKLFFMSEYLAKDNPTGLKIGGKILLIKSNNGIPKYLEGETFVIRTSPPSRNAVTVGVTASTGINYTLYYTGGGSGYAADVFRLMSRKEEAKWLREKVEKMKVEIDEMIQRAFELEEFETEEEYVAYKLAKILEAGSNPKAIAEILRTMKESNLL